MYLTQFHSLRPPFERTQQETLDWLVAAHKRADGTDCQEALWKVGCKPLYIAQRGTCLADFSHQNWEAMQIYRLHEEPSGLSLSHRTQAFEEYTDPIFERYYPDTATAPDDLIHVSCTGYTSPSGAQKIVSKKRWLTTVTHAYHMGCYGSMPAIRMGRGFLSSSPEKTQIDIVHTELCSLHVNPSLHTTDQLVSQSLFADGFMKYSLQRASDGPAFRILNIREEILPDSQEAMSWNVMSWGFQMSLAKEVPVHIIRALPSFLERLGAKDPLLFAVHPGGPKILSYVQKALNLSDEQMRFSFSILKKYGNMSSATLPHIWQEILQDETVANGTNIVSLAFGPGLTVAGSLMEKVCGS